MNNRSLHFLILSVAFLSLNNCSVTEKVPQYQKSTRAIAALPTTVNGREQFALWKNYKIRFEEFGHGSEEALVFIHGWACDSSIWNFQVNEFSARQRVITIDLPGHGKSKIPSSSLKYSVDEFTEAINSVFETLGLQKAVLVGHSLGGVVVRHYYRKFPERVMGLIVVDSELGLWTKESVDIVKRRANDLKTKGYKEVIASMVDEMFVPSTSESLKSEIKSKMTSTSKAVVGRALLGLAEQKLYTSDVITVPTMVIRAKHESLRPDNGQFLKSIIKNLSYQEWEGIGHFLMMEDPIRFNKAVLSFLLKNRF